eukprot:TRINITY_DN13771_c0_g1_i1.p1 TRINITY_DN13771_c0_g1~~TRINITY_DN13771_c0_g1_i1.p1  ORF type:complete len:670 (-),score=188.98 TRINITY_DN13771_c0_g1_i1:49-2058(-)
MINDNEILTPVITGEHDESTKNVLNKINNGDGLISNFFKAFTNIREKNEIDPYLEEILDNIKELLSDPTSKLRRRIDYLVNNFEQYVDKSFEPERQKLPQYLYKITKDVCNEENVKSEYISKVYVIIERFMFSKIVDPLKEIWATEFAAEEIELKRKCVALANTTQATIGIKKKFQDSSLYPWSEAVAQLRTVSICTCPWDMLTSIFRCVNKAFELLSEQTKASDSIIETDDILHVLMYILVASNVPNLWFDLMITYAFNYLNDMSSQITLYLIHVISAGQTLIEIDETQFLPLHHPLLEVPILVPYLSSLMSLELVRAHVETLTYNNRDDDGELYSVNSLKLHGFRVYLDTKSLLDVTQLLKVCLVKTDDPNDFAYLFPVRLTGLNNVQCNILDKIINRNKMKTHLSDQGSFNYYEKSFIDSKPQFEYIKIDIDSIQLEGMETIVERAFSNIDLKYFGYEDIDLLKEVNFEVFKELKRTFCPSYDEINEIIPNKLIFKNINQVFLKIQFMYKLLGLLPFPISYAKHVDVTILRAMKLFDENFKSLIVHIPISSLDMFEITPIDFDSHLSLEYAKQLRILIFILSSMLTILGHCKHLPFFNLTLFRQELKAFQFSQKFTETGVLDIKTSTRIVELFNEMNQPKFPPFPVGFHDFSFVEELPVFSDILSQ